MKRTFLLLALLSFVPVVQAQTCSSPVTLYQDDFSSNSLGNYDYWGDHWTGATAAGNGYSVTGGQMRIAPPSLVYSFTLVNNAYFNHALSDYTLEGDFMVQAGPAVFGLVFRSDPSALEAYIFQWNGMNNRWEIEKKRPGGYNYPASGNPIPAYTYGTWIHLRVVVGPGNTFCAYANLNDGAGERLVFGPVTDTFPTPAPYPNGAVGVRIYSVSTANPAYVDNFTAYTCVTACGAPPAATATSTPTRTPTATLTPTPTLGSGPLDLFEADKNVWSPMTQGALNLYVEYPYAGSPYHLKIYNSAGEHVRTLFDKSLAGPVSETHPWDGNNHQGELCASGIYLLVLTEPFDRKVRRVLLVR